MEITLPMMLYRKFHQSESRGDQIIQKSLGLLTPMKHHLVGLAMLSKY